MRIAYTYKMNDEGVRNWFAGICGLFVAAGNYSLSIVTLDLVNFGDLISKGLTALVVGGLGAVGGVLGKLFIGWLKRVAFKFFSKYFNKKPASK